MDQRPGGKLRQGFEGLGSSILLPGLNKIRKAPSKAMLVPGLVAVLAVVGLFWSLQRPTVGSLIGVARYKDLAFALTLPLSFWIIALGLSLGTVYLIYRMCGTPKAWWALLVPAVAMWVLMLPWFAHPWLTFFHDFLVNGVPMGKAAEGVDATTRLVKIFFGVGLNEEIWKALPIGLCILLGLNLQGPMGRQVGVREPLDGILIGVVCGVTFAVIETMGQYVPKLLTLGGAAIRQTEAAIPQLIAQATAMAQANGLRGADIVSFVSQVLPLLVQKHFLSLSGYDSIVLTIARILGNISGHAAYSGYIGYFIGLAVMRPAQRVKLLAIGFGVAALLHTLWDFGGGDAWYLVIAMVAFAFLVGAVLKARELSPHRDQNFATRVLPPEPAATSFAAAPFAAAPAAAPGMAAPAVAAPAAIPVTGEYGLALGPKLIVLREGTRLMQGDIGGLAPAEAGGLLAEVITRPDQPGVLGLRNASASVWQVAISNDQGTQHSQVPTGKTVRLVRGSRIHFGPVEGLIR